MSEPEDPIRTGPWQPALSEPQGADPVAVEKPPQIGRYRVVSILGEGGFGRVYLAHDDKLNRPVAIKVPHRQLVARPEDAEAYLAEAQNVANLDHHHIVPVYDVGAGEDCPCFIVSKFIEGTTLAKKIKDDRPSFSEAAELVATVAEALHYAHCKGLVHRDIKPGNILLDLNGKPFVVDFGLALKEEHVGQGLKYAGTPPYMSPEQARGEGHRVDGRSDIFSLGVVFYELLTGRRPFKGQSKEELLEQITDFEPRPLRQIDESIPKELERICFKALSKRAAERYLTAKDMADDLQHFLAQQSTSQQAVPAGMSIGSRLATSVVQPSSPAAGSSPSGASSPTATPPTSDSRPIKIVPKGLRSFDEHDADFFLELLPDPRDREGLPNSIRFWKTRIEETDPEKTFAVGLLCGPSGCGKSSLVKAGLLPRLSDEVLVVYLEATTKETETRLLNGLRKCCPALLANLGLKETLTALRRGQGVPMGKKVLIILDQFEQWLHAKKEEENTELVQALRHCDGGRVQCLVLVRDDFWMAVIRFMRDLEIRLIEGQNSAAVDLFPLRHAEKVLAAFGRAFGVLSDRVSETSKEQKEFLIRAVSGLAQENKVICVRLALFAEMMKGRPWTPATLKEVGGTEGVGVNFLEGTFSAATAPPEHRYHQKAAQAVLKALLPDAGTDIKGHMRSQQELLKASGYANRPRDFDDLLRILDSELRLITPTDPECKEETASRIVQAGEKYYQLTHDYLVSSLREWLTRKQKETRRGRAELLLADRASVWNARPENRQLPSLSQWLQIRWLTQKKNWTPPQRKMMGKASRVHVVRAGIGAVLLAVASFTGLTIWDRIEENQKANHAAGLVQTVLNADIAQVPAIVSQMTHYRQWADPLLRDENSKAADKSRQKLHTSLALLPADPSQVKYLKESLLDAEPGEVAILRDALLPHKDQLVGELWPVVEAPEKGKEARRLRAAAALAKYDPENQKWTKTQEDLDNDFVAVPAVFLSVWMDSLRPVRAKLLPQLSVIYRDKSRRETERSLATNILADYAADNPQLLADLLMDADDQQFAVIFAPFKGQGEKGLALLTSEIDKKLPAQLPSSDEKREKRAKRQANAAVALLRLNQPEKVWPLLKHSPDPRVRSYLIHRLSPLGADAGAVIERLEEEPDVTIRRALFLSLGEFSEEQLPADVRSSLLGRLKEIYGTEADPGLHAAVEWLLRQWKKEDWLKQMNEEWAKNERERNQRTETIQELVTKDKDKTPRQWYVNSQGQTMVVIPGPVEFMMGSPPTEDGRQALTSQHKRRIGRTFALAAKPVTVREFRRFLKDNKLETWFEAGGLTAPGMKRYSPDEDGPIILVDWYWAAAYCNWLSEQEGIPEVQWCYETNAGKLSQEKLSGLVSLLAPQHALVRAANTSLLVRQPQVTALKKGYLGLRGYRLPMEAEMEYACRAGAVTSRYYGETEELLVEYGWYLKNSKDRTWPVGGKKPNDLGMFDLHGNVWNWCQESYGGDYSVPEGEGKIEDKEDSVTIVTTQSRVLRGGSFVTLAVNVRSAYRNKNQPIMRSSDFGLRPARTFTP